MAGRKTPPINTSSLLFNVYDKDIHSIKISGTSPFNTVGVHNLTSIFNYQSSWGLSYLRDVLTNTNSANSYFEQNTGFIKLETGTTTNSKSRIETVELGRYIAGKSSECIIGAEILSLPQTSGHIRWGIGDVNLENAAFFEHDKDGFKIRVFSSGVEVETVTRSNWNRDTLDGSRNENNPSGHSIDKLIRGYLYGVRFATSGFGKIEFICYMPNLLSIDALDEIIVHSFDPESNRDFSDSNLPVFIEVFNDSSTTDIKARLEGRNYSILGDFTPEIRQTGEITRSKNVVASGNPYTSLISVKRKTNFPNGTTKLNSVPIYLEDFQVITDRDLELYIASNVNSHTAYSNISLYSNNETAIQSNTTIRTFTLTDSRYLISGPYIVEAGQGAQGIRRLDSSLNIPLIRNDDLCLVARNFSGANATVTATMRIREEW